MKLNFSYILFPMLLLAIAITRTNGQKSISDSLLVQFSGVVVAEEKDTISPIPFANIFIPGTGRGTYSNLDGFFSIVAQKGQTIEFSALGYKTIEYVIPDTLSTNRYSIIQLMSKDSIVLPQATIYPWPSKEHFKQEFLALEVPDQELMDLAEENLSPEKLQALQKFTPRSGEETSAFYLQQQAKTYYYMGQTPPMNILSPIAWAKFIKSLKNGDFKSKSKQ
ncbi:carboxypeptidase-like regulatory domain-containing protein [Membranihabitans maritimus]|uniref:carboxypeptidase-like regulatory domain-containing protein n=1 Tax=Membranihabitans maritimus TaxID=2904244 RepID=UPI001F34D769|nr:carboxypeptidase-like regulatory domain-containing protein [Membranihabitans maritimus]